MPPPKKPQQKKPPAKKKATPRNKKAISRISVRGVLLLASIAVAVAIIALGLVILFTPTEKLTSGLYPQQDTSTPERPAPQPAKPTPQPEIPDSQPQANAPTLIFIFDDAGQTLPQLQPFLSLPFPATIAVLPGLPHSVQAAEQIREAGKEAILHQPMQALNSAINPGPGAIKPDMTPDEIRLIVRANIEEIAPIAGMNNHEGSMITESADAIGAVLDVCRENGLYFLDSKTTSGSQAPNAAKARNMRIWARDVFLDNTKDKADILEQLHRGLAIAERTGSAVLIGHVTTPGLAQILLDEYPGLVEKGYRFSTISAENKVYQGIKYESIGD